MQLVCYRTLVPEAASRERVRERAEGEIEQGGHGRRGARGRFCGLLGRPLARPRHQCKISPPSWVTMEGRKEELIKLMAAKAEELERLR